MTRAARGAAAMGDDGFAALLDKVSRDRGFACASYKERCLRRRVGVRMRARGVAAYEDYARLLDEDATEYDRLLDALTINVTRLFRNWEAWDALATEVIPSLWSRPAAAGGLLRIWSAGCATGQETASLAVLLHRHAERTGTLSRLASVRVVGTDVDGGALAAASRGEFDDGDFVDTPPTLRHRYFAPEPPFVLDPAARALVQFRPGDMLSSAPPTPRAELIVCRNVLIYFDKPSQERVLQQFHDVLTPDGFLMLGKVEGLVGASRALFTPVNARERIYRRAG